MVKLRTGVKWGDVLPLILLIFEKVIREMKIGRNEGIIMDSTCFSLLSYADDLVLLGKKEQKVVGLCGRLIELVK